MLLSPQLLGRVSYYESSTKNSFFNDEPYTKVTLHFHEWWRPSKTFKFKYICTDISNDIATYKESTDARALKLQLAKYFNANV